MNIEAYDLDSLRGLVRSLQKENFILKEKLKKANIPFDDENPFEGSDSNMEKYDPDQGGRIHFPLVKDIVLSECQFRMTLRFFLLINLTDKAVINLYFLLPESAFVFDRFMHYDFINHIVQ